jgi:hypothetical protein
MTNPIIDFIKYFIDFWKPDNYHWPEKVYCRNCNRDFTKEFKEAMFNADKFYAFIAKNYAINKTHSVDVGNYIWLYPVCKYCAEEKEE